MMYKNLFFKLHHDWGHAYQCDIEVLLQFEDAEVGSRGEGRATMCDGYVGRTIQCKPNTRTGVLNPNRL